MEAVDPSGTLDGSQAPAPRSDSAALMVTSDAVLAPSQGWAVEVAALKPETLATLVQVARDMNSDAHLADRCFAVAAKALDRLAADDAAQRALLEAGVAELDRRAGGAYLKLGPNSLRIDALDAVSGTPFDQILRDAIDRSLDEQRKVWRRIGL